MATVKVNGTDRSTNYTPEEWAAISLRFEAFDGQVGQGTAPIPDPAGTQTPYAGESFQFIGPGPVTLLDGFVGPLERERGAAATGTRLVNTYSIGDENAVLHGFRAYRWVRPAESTRTRFLAFLATYVPWVTDTTWVTGAVVADLPKKTYTTETLFDDLFTEIRDLTGNTAFVENHRGHLHPATNGIASGIAFTDGAVTPPYTTTFPIYNPRRSKDPLDLRDDVMVTTPGGVSIQTDATAIARHDAGGLKHQALIELAEGTAAEATAKAIQILADSKAERITYEFDTGPMTAAQLAAIPVGCLINVTSAVMGLSASTQRIAGMTVSYKIGDLFYPKIELGFPIRTRRAAPRTAGPIASTGGGTGQGQIVFTPPGLIARQTFADADRVRLTWYQHLETTGTSPHGSGATIFYLALPTSALYAQEDIGGGTTADYAMFMQHAAPMGALFARLSARVWGLSRFPVTHYWAVYAGVTTTPTWAADTGSSRLLASGSVTPESGYFPPTDPAIDYDDISVEVPVVGGKAIFGLSFDMNTPAIEVAGEIYMTRPDQTVLVGSTDVGTFYYLDFYGTIPSPTHGQPVIGELDFTGDGTTAVMRTNYGYLAGSLVVTIDGIPVSPSNVTETDPAAGTYTISPIPAAGDIIRASYQAAGT